MEGVLTGAIALIRVNGNIVGKMRSISVQENFSRQEVRGIGTIFATEVPVTSYAGTLSCEQMSVDYASIDGIPGAIDRDFANAASQVLNGNESFEDQLVLNILGVQVDIFKKISDVIDPITKKIKPKLRPYAVVNGCHVESSSFSIQEGNLTTVSQSFKFTEPVLRLGAAPKI